MLVIIIIIIVERDKQQKVCPVKQVEEKKEKPVDEQQCMQWWKYWNFDMLFDHIALSQAQEKINRPLFRFNTSTVFLYTCIFLESHFWPAYMRLQSLVSDIVSTNHFICACLDLMCLPRLQFLQKNGGGRPGRSSCVQSDVVMWTQWLTLGGGYLGSCGDKIWEWPGNEAS